MEWVFPYRASANPEEKPLVFVVDPNLRKPLIIYCPCPHEFKRIPPTINRPIPPKVPSKKADKQPIQPSIEQSYGSGDVQDLIRKYSAQYRIKADAPLCIAKLESGFNPASKNKSSTASGVFQYLSGTWKATDEGKSGASVFNADSNVKAAIKYMSSRKNAKPWTVHTKCPPVTPIN